MAEELNKQGLFVDDLYILRVCDPNVAKETQELTENNAIFLEKLTEFRGMVQEITNLLESFAKQIDQEKMRAINAQNYLNSSSKQKEIEQQQIQTKIIEKTLELDKLKIEYQYLVRVESEQQEIFDTLEPR